MTHPVSWKAAIAAAWLSAACAASAVTWKFDFGPGGTASDPSYNNIVQQGVHTHPNLTDENGVATAVSLSVTVPFNTASTNANGTTAPAPELGFAASATRDSFFGNTAAFQGQVAPRAQLRLTGLDPRQLYDFTLFASRMGVTDNRQTEYRLTGLAVQTAYLDPAGNTAQAASVQGIQPRADGSIDIDVQPGPDNANASGFFYLGAMRVTSRPPPTCGGSDPALDDKLTAYDQPGTGTYPLAHWLYRPAGYSQAPCAKLPLLVFLHGAGERCPGAPLASLNKSSLNSPGYQIQSGSAYAAQRPFLQGLVLQPQTCDGAWTAASIDAMVEHVKASTGRVDEDRIYVTGLSLGGGGTWSYAAAHPGKLAAMVPIAGTEKALSTIHAASHVPTWAFHNYNDTNTSPLGPTTDLFRCKSHTHRQCTIEHLDRMVPFASTRVMKGYSPDDGQTMADTDRIALLRPGGERLPTRWTWESAAVPAGGTSGTMFTLYAANGHSGWSRTYGLAEMWSWLYAQRRAAVPPLGILSRSIAPTSAAVGSGATVTVKARIQPDSAPVAEVWVDLKSLGGSHSAKMTLVDPVARSYQLVHRLPATGLAPGMKGIAIVAVEPGGHRSIQYTTFTLTQ